MPIVRHGDLCVLCKKTYSHDELREWVCINTDGKSKYAHLHPANYVAEQGYPAVAPICKHCHLIRLYSEHNQMINTTIMAIQEMAWEAAQLVVCRKCLGAYAPFDVNCECRAFAIIEKAVELCKDMYDKMFKELVMDK